MKQPLSGVRILDFTKLLPGPLATMMLAEMGAEVIKIEHPGSPDYIRDVPPHHQGFSAFYLAVNRSKKSVLLDYKKEEGKAVLLKLMETADVIIEQFRPGVMDAWGIGYKIACETKPGMIYVALTGYGQHGPYAQQAGHDLNYLALSGVLSLFTDDQGKPVIPGVQLADIASGAYLTVSATLAALLKRPHEPKGQFVDVSMMDGLLPMLALPMAQLWGEGKSIHKKDIMLAGNLVNYNVYQCADGQWVALGALEPKFWFRFCEMVQKPEWQKYMIPGEALADDAKTKLETLFATKTMEEWLALAAAHDVCLSPVQPLEALENDPHIGARKMIFDQEHPVAGTLKNLGNPLTSGIDPAQYAGPAPAKGQHTQTILSDIGLDQTTIERISSK